MLLAVVDTNVWVSAFITPGGVPDRLLSGFVRGALRPVVSAEIILEYAEVLQRSRWAIEPALLREFMSLLRQDGLLVTPSPTIITPLKLPDPDDACFINAALHAACPVITGNTRHFPAATGVKTLTPRAALDLLDG